MPDEQKSILNNIEIALQDYLAQQEQEEQARWKMVQLAKLFDLNLSGLTQEETAILLKALEKSKKYKRMKRR